MKVIKHLMGWMGKGIPVYYVTGNHDEMLRRFAGFQLGTLQIVNKIVLKLPDNKRAWVFHGDVFDVTMQHSKWLAKLGAIGYDTLILINKAANFFSQRVLGRGKLSLSKRIKNSVKSAIKFINDFEQTAAEIAIANGYDYVICGHIHQPDIRQIHHGDKSVLYLNSGDWIENLTALEYTNGEWQLYRHPAEAVQVEDEETDPSTKELFNELFQELTIVPL
jgi:UDP-2,3-diacylglucosamine pyrophosphatase LpxH